MGRVTKLFYFAGIVNIYAVLTTFWDEFKISLYPSVFSRFGLVIILLWGFAYIIVANDLRSKVILIFAIEKFIYFLSWVVWWIANYSIFDTIIETSVGTAIFYASYGIIDLSFGIFFMWVYMNNK